MKNLTILYAAVAFVVMVVATFVGVALYDLIIGRNSCCGGNEAGSMKSGAAKGKDAMRKPSKDFAAKYNLRSLYDLTPAVAKSLGAGGNGRAMIVVASSRCPYCHKAGEKMCGQSHDSNGNKVCGDAAGPFPGFTQKERNRVFSFVIDAKSREEYESMNADALAHLRSVGLSSVVQTMKEKAGSGVPLVILVKGGSDGGVVHKVNAGYSDEVFKGYKDWLRSDARSGLASSTSKSLSSNLVLLNNVAVHTRLV